MSIKIKNVNAWNAGVAGRTRVATVFAILALTFLSGCGTTPINTPGEVQANTQLAISPNGSRLLVSWNDSSGKLHARLAELNGTAVVSERDINLPEDTLTTSFGNSNDYVLLTTWNKKNSSLIKINLGKDDPEIIYKSDFLLRFPLEVSSGNYVFLEGSDPKSRTNHWRRYQNGQRTLLNDQNYGMADILNVVGDALFILEPSLNFRNIHGTLPAGLSELVVKETFNIKCADRNPLICVRQKIHTDNGESSYFETLTLINDSRRCEISGNWLDQNELRISRNGSTVVFHAAINKRDGPRAIYVAKNQNHNCPINPVSIKGSKEGASSIAEHTYPKTLSNQ